MLPLRLRIIQLVGELAIPLAGYFWWHWDFYFIGLFYVLDLLVSLVFTGIKWRYIQREQHNVNAYVLLWGLLLLSLFLGGFLLLLLLRVSRRI